jgi:hypothetical protein
VIPADLIPTVLAAAGQVVQGLLAVAIVLVLFVLYAVCINGGQIE